jgi:trimethylamine--corrinoid protein Co-methyltransferase
LGQRALILEGCNTYYGTGSDCPFTIDLETGERRKSTKSDVARFAHLVDALPNIDFVMSMGIASDANELTSFVHQFQAMVENTVKPIVFTTHGIEDMHDIYEMAVAVKGGPEQLKQEPFLLLYSEPIPPQRHTRMGLEKLIFCAKHQIPVTYPTGAMAGCSAPATLAGAVALGNAETLVGLVIHQLTSPGAPYVYGGNTSIMDMSTGLFTYAAPEFQLTLSAYADLGKFYGLPVWALAGATDSKTVDAQAGLEAGFQMIMAELSGAQLIHDVGYLDSGLCSSMEMVCLGNEMASLARHVSRGIRVEPDDFALDVIDEVGPGGMFLAADHTVENFRKEFWFPKVLVRGTFDTWRQSGSKSICQRLNQQAKDAMASHQPSRLPEEVTTRLNQIIEERESRLAGGVTP